MTPFETAAALAHATHYQWVCIEVGSFVSKDETEALRRLFQHLGQIRQAHDWINDNALIDRDAGLLAIRYCIALEGLTQMLPRDEQLAWLSLAIACLGSYDLELGEEVDQDRYRAQLQLECASVQRRRGDVENANRLLGDALAYAQRICSFDLEARAHELLGEWHATAGEYGRAIEELETALRLRKQVGSDALFYPQHEMVLLQELVMSYSCTGMFRKALKYSKLISTLARRSGREIDEINAVFSSVDS